MTRSEILEKIGKLQKLESNPNVAQIFKDDAKTKIAVLEAQMAALDNAEKVTDATPSVPQPKEAKQSEPKLKTSKPKAKKDADGLKLPGTQVIENYGDHKLMHSSEKGTYYFVGHAKGGLIGKSFENEADAKAAHKEVLEKLGDEAAKPTPSVQKPKKEKTDKVDAKTKMEGLTWEKPVTGDLLKEAESGMLTCDMKFIKAVQKMSVIVPVEAEEGDIIVLDAKTNRPMLVIKKAYANRRCLTAKAGETMHIVVEKSDEPVKKIELTGSGRKETPINHTDDTPNEKPSEKDIETIKAHHQSDCTIAEYNRDMPNVPVRAWLEDMVEQFNANKTNQYVTKVLITKEGEVLAKVTNKSALGWMLTPEWVRVCPERGTMTLLENAPKRGNYEVEVDEQEIREFYSDADDYSKCRHWISQVYKIRAGEAEGDKKALYQKWAEGCRNSNLVERYKKLHRYIHKKARNIREETPHKYASHYEAVRSVRAMLKKAETKIKD